jgi:hypothetical protein
VRSSVNILLTSSTSLLRKQWFSHFIKFDMKTNSFFTLLVWQMKLSSEPKTEIIKVPEAWVNEEFGEQIVNMRQEDLGWTQTSRDVAVYIGKWKIARVRYLPERVRFITDVKLLNKKLKS